MGQPVAPPCPCAPPPGPDLHTEPPSQATITSVSHKDASTRLSSARGAGGAASSQEVKPILQRTKTFSSSPTPQNYLACGCGIAKDMNALQKPGQKRCREVSAAHEGYQNTVRLLSRADTELLLITGSSTLEQKPLPAPT